MATKSFLKDVHIRGKKQAYSFIRALEKSKNGSEKDIYMSKAVSDMTREEMKKMFPEKKAVRQ